MSNTEKTTRIKELIILKMGGAAITDKKQERTPHKQTITQVAKGLSQFEQTPPIIIVHGAGSYGHPYAYKHRLVEGYIPSQKNQLLGLIETHLAVRELHNLILHELYSYDLPVISFPPHSFFYRYEEGWKTNIDALDRALELGLIPVLHGDIAFRSDAKKFTILSGDVIIQELARHFNPKEVLYGTDVDGLFTNDPSTDPGAEFIPKLSYSELKTLIQEFSEVNATKKDVTSGIKGKLEAILQIIEMKIPASIFNLRSETYLLDYVLGKSLFGTKFLPQEE
ncbi:MAG: isopentenyl phosphate kinase [Candidatus Kariarchaeaceae archaeon]